MSSSSHDSMVTAFFPAAGCRLSPGTLLREGSQRLLTALELCCRINFWGFVVSFSPTPSVLIPFVVGTVHEVVSSLMSANLNAYINNSEGITTVPMVFNPSFLHSQETKMTGIGHLSAACDLQCWTILLWIVRMGNQQCWFYSHKRAWVNVHIESFWQVYSM